MIITIFSPSGGVGKTTIALATADTLSKHGRTCLLDLDFTPGDIAVLTNIELKPLTDAFRDGPLVAIQRPEKGNFDVLTGGYPDTGEAIEYKAINKLIEDLKMQYQYVVIDTQSHLTSNVVAALLAADTIVIPVIDEIAGVAKLAGMIEYLEKNKYADMGKAIIVVNRVNKKDRYISAAKLSVAITCRIPEFSNMRDHHDVKFRKALSPLFEKWGQKTVKRS